jgi:hypothetical protein
MKSKGMMRKGMAHRDSAHTEKGFAPRMESHMSHGSPASKGAFKGNGHFPGADRQEAVYGVPSSSDEK